MPGFVDFFQLRLVYADVSYNPVHRYRDFLIAVAIAIVNSNFFLTIDNIPLNSAYRDSAKAIVLKLLK